MRFDGVDFNMKVIRRMTEKEFVDHEMHNNHYTHLPEKKKKELLRTIYQIIQRFPVESDTSESKGQD